MSLTSKKSKFYYSAFLLLLFFLMSLLNVMKHEMWRDELQPWLIVQNSESLLHLFQNIRYEGHPALWFLILFCLEKISSNPLIMQIFHVIIATGVIYILVIYSPFTKIQKLFITFGYFPFYEYAVISRNYVLGIFGIFAFCLLYPIRKRSYMMISLCLFLTCQTNIYGLIFVISACCLLMSDFCVENDIKNRFYEKKLDIMISVSIVIFGICISIIQMLPPEDSGFATGWYHDFDLYRFKNVISGIWNSYFPIPKINIQFWGSNILEEYLTTCFSLSLLLVVLICILLYPSPLVMGLFFIGTACILAFSYMKNPGFIRHHGHLFIVLVCCFWLSEYYSPVKLKIFPDLSSRIIKYRNFFFTLILFVHLIAGNIAVFFDLKYPFSASKEAAKYIEKIWTEELLLAGNVDAMASAVAGQLGKEIYYPSGNRTGTYIIWDTKRLEDQTPDYVFDKLLQLGKKSNKNILLISSYKISVEGKPLPILAQFTESIVADEQYYLYYLFTK